MHQFLWNTSVHSAPWYTPVQINTQPLPIAPVVELNAAAKTLAVKQVTMVVLADGTVLLPTRENIGIIKYGSSVMEILVNIEYGTGGCYNVDTYSVLGDTRFVLLRTDTDISVLATVIDCKIGTVSVLHLQITTVTGGTATVNLSTNFPACFSIGNANPCIQTQLTVHNPLPHSSSSSTVPTWLLVIGIGKYTTSSTDHYLIYTGVNITNGAILWFNGIYITSTANSWDEPLTSLSLVPTLSDIQTFPNATTILVFAGQEFSGAIKATASNGEVLWLRYKDRYLKKYDNSTIDNIDQATKASTVIIGTAGIGPLDGFVRYNYTAPNDCTLLGPSSRSIHYVTYGLQCGYMLEKHRIQTINITSGKAIGGTVGLPLDYSPSSNRYFERRIDAMLIDDEGKVIIAGGEACNCYQRGTKLYGTINNETFRYLSDVAGDQSWTAINHGYSSTTYASLLMMGPDKKLWVTDGTRSIRRIRKCTAGTYCGGNINDWGWTPLPCPKGSYCPAGSYEPVGCPRNTANTLLSQTSIDACIPCSTGYYANVTGQEECTYCAPNSGFCTPGPTVSASATGTSSSSGSASGSQSVSVTTTITSSESARFTVTSTGTVSRSSKSSATFTPSATKSSSGSGSGTVFPTKSISLTSSGSSSSSCTVSSTASLSISDVSSVMTNHASLSPSSTYKMEQTSTVSFYVSSNSTALNTAASSPTVSATLIPTMTSNGTKSMTTTIIPTVTNTSTLPNDTVALSTVSATGSSLPCETKTTATNIIVFEIFLVFMSTSNVTTKLLPVPIMNSNLPIHLAQSFGELLHLPACLVLANTFTDIATGAKYFYDTPLNSSGTNSFSSNDRRRLDLTNSTENQEGTQGITITMEVLLSASMMMTNEVSLVQIIRDISPSVSNTSGTIWSNITNNLWKQIKESIGNTFRVSSTDVVAYIDPQSIKVLLNTNYVPVVKPNAGNNSNSMMDLGIIVGGIVSVLGLMMGIGILVYVHYFKRLKKSKLITSLSPQVSAKSSNAVAAITRQRSRLRNLMEMTNSFVIVKNLSSNVKEHESVHAHRNKYVPQGLEIKEQYRRLQQDRSRNISLTVVSTRSNISPTTSEPTISSDREDSNPTYRYHRSMMNTVDPNDEFTFENYLFLEYADDKEKEPTVV